MIGQHEKKRAWGGDRFYQVEQPAAPVPKAGKFLKCSPMRRGGLMLSVWFFFVLVTRRGLGGLRLTRLRLTPGFEAL